VVQEGLDHLYHHGLLFVQVTLPGLAVLLHLLIQPALAFRACQVFLVSHVRPGFHSDLVHHQLRVSHVVLVDQWVLEVLLNLEHRDDRLDLTHLSDLERPFSLWARRHLICRSLLRNPLFQASHVDLAVRVDLGLQPVHLFQALLYPLPYRVHRLYQEDLELLLPLAHPFFQASLLSQAVPFLLCFHRHQDFQVVRGFLGVLVNRSFQSVLLPRFHLVVLVTRLVQVAQAHREFQDHLFLPSVL